MTRFCAAESRSWSVLLMIWPGGFIHKLLRFRGLFQGEAQYTYK